MSLTQRNGTVSSVEFKDSSLATGRELFRNTEDAIPLNVDDGGSGEVVDIMTIEARGRGVYCVDSRL